jgi:TolA-binding protein
MMNSRYPHICTSLVAAILFFICCLPSVSHSQDETQIHALQVFSSKELPQAESFANELKQKGYAPVTIFPKGEFNAVCIGIFPNYADAVYYKEKLRAGAFPDAFILTRSASEISGVPSLLSQQLKTDEAFQGAIRNSSAIPLKGRKTASVITQTQATPLPPSLPDSIRKASNSALSEDDLLKKATVLFEEKNYEDAIKAYRDFVTQFFIRKRIPEAGLGIGNTLLKQEKIPEAKTAFQNLIQNQPQSNQAGEASLRLAYLKIREKDDAGAITMFQNITSGMVKADVSVKSEAQLRLDNFARRELIKNDPAFGLLHQGYAKLAASENENATQLFEQVISSYPQSEAAGEASLRLSYKNLEQAKNASEPNAVETLKESALSGFESIARGDIKSSPHIRLEAMLRCARTYHSRKERIRALQAYREIAALADSDGVPDPDIHTELAGLYMELARSGKGSLDDCIRECNVVLTTEGASRKSKSTALQMKAEAFHFKNDFKTAIELEKSLIENYPEQKPMLMLAHFYMGLSYYQINDPYLAQKAFEKVINDFKDEDNLPGNDMRFSSRLYQAQALLKMEKRPEAKAILKEIIKEKPSSKEALNAQKLIDVLK